VLRLPFSRRIKQQSEAFDDDVSPYCMLSGGYGGGKSYWLFMKLLKLSALNKEAAGGLLCPSLPEFKRDMLPMMLEYLSSNVPNARYYSNGRYGIHFKLPWTKHPLFIFTAERPVKGPNLGWGGINEFSLMPKERIDEMISRIRVPCPSPQLCFAGTPEDDFLWLEEFVDKHTKTGKLKVRTVSTFDNVFNSKEYGQNLVDNLDPEAAQLYVYGKMTRLGRDYFYYAYKPTVNDFPIEYDESQLIHVGLDFNVGRMSAVFAQVYGDGDRKQLGFFGELILKNHTSDTKEMGLALAARFDKRNLLITCDASGRARKTTGLSDVKTLESMGFKMRYKTANPRIRRSQLLVNGLLAKRKILINSEACPTLKRDLLKVEQKSDFEMDKSHDELTHAADGLRYLCDQEFPDFLDKSLRTRYKTSFA